VRRVRVQRGRPAAARNLDLHGEEAAAGLLATSVETHEVLHHGEALRHRDLCVGDGPAAS
jgi:hypothetical protein